MNLLIISGLSNHKLISKIAPIAYVDFVEKIFLVRRHPLSYHKVICYPPPKILRSNIVLSEIYRLMICFYLCIFKKVDIIMGIFLICHGIYAGIIGKLFSKPVIQNIIGTDLLSILRYPILIRFLKNSNIIVTRGVNTKQILTNKGLESKKIFYVPNLFDFNKIPKTGNKDSEKQYDLIFVGNLVKEKRLDILLNAIKKIKFEDHFAHIKLAILGDGYLKTGLQEMAQRLNVAENIFFLGFQRDVYPFLNKSRIFILTSEIEGLPMAMIEAMSCGLPCIVPDISDITTVARDYENALLVPVGDMEGFAEKINLLLTDEKLYTKLSQNSLRISKEKAYEYSIENITDVWNTILNKISSQPPNKNECM